MKVWNRHTIPKDVKATYIGRGTIWGNPFVVGSDRTQAQAADDFRKKLARTLAARDRVSLNMVLSLKGVNDIVCSCAPRPCHGDSFAEIWNIIREKDLLPLEGIREWVKRNGYPYGPATDSIDHVNIYSKGATALGRFLTNMGEFFVTIPDIGRFRTLEGYWHYLKTGSDDKRFMTLDGFSAKQLAKTKDTVDVPDFRDRIKEAMRIKLIEHPHFQDMFFETKLVFTHYYCYNGDDRTVTYPPYDWITEEWTRLRSAGKLTG